MKLIEEIKLTISDIENKISQFLANSFIAFMKGINHD